VSLKNSKVHISSQENIFKKSKTNKQQQEDVSYLLRFANFQVFVQMENKFINMPRQRKFNQRTKAAATNSLEMARDAKKIKKNMRKYRDSGIVVAPPVQVGMAARYLTRIICELALRSACLTSGAPYPGTPEGACMHPTTVGSSQIKKLGQPAGISLKQLHQRVYNKEARKDGREWEIAFEREAARGGFVADGLIVLEMLGQVSQYSPTMPWVCATPDYVARVKRTAEGTEFLALIEVKSAKSPATFKTALSHHEMQLQVAMDCFQIDKGFMVVFRDEGDYDCYEYAVHPVSRKGVLGKDEKKIVWSYARFLVKCLYSLTGENMPIAPIEEELKRIVSLARPKDPPTFKEIKNWPKLPERPNCFWNDRHKGQPAKKYITPEGQEEKIIVYRGSSVFVADH
jgi:hypothetical protein